MNYHTSLKNVAQYVIEYIIEPDVSAPITILYGLALTFGNSLYNPMKAPTPKPNERSFAFSTLLDRRSCLVSSSLQEPLNEVLSILIIYKNSGYSICALINTQLHIIYCTKHFSWYKYPFHYNYIWKHHHQYAAINQISTYQEELLFSIAQSAQNTFAIYVMSARHRVTQQSTVLPRSTNK